MSDHLGSLAVGEEAVVSGFVKDAGEYRTKLLAMGLTKGIRLKVTRVAPLGDPLEIEIRASRLSIRRREAVEVYLR